MMSEESNELDELYQDVILDHFKRPRFKHAQKECLVCQPGKNPLCGDELTIYVNTKEDGTLHVSFEGHG